MRRSLAPFRGFELLGRLMRERGLRGPRYTREDAVLDLALADEVSPCTPEECFDVLGSVSGLRWPLHQAMFYPCMKRGGVEGSSRRERDSRAPMRVMLKANRRLGEILLAERLRRGVAEMELLAECMNLRVADAYMLLELARMFDGGVGGDREGVPLVKLGPGGDFVREIVR